MSGYPKKRESPKGKDCTCAAHGECECGCGADWSDNHGYNQAIDEFTEELKRRCEWLEVITQEVCKNFKVFRWEEFSTVIGDTIRNHILEGLE